MTANDDEAVALVAFLVAAVFCAAMMAAACTHFPRGPDRCCDVAP